MEVGAPPARAWAALVSTVGGGFGGGGSSAFARLLGCAEWQAEGDPGVAGSTVVGFRVAAAQAPRLLELEGEHRFSRYRLGFRIDEAPGGSRVSATTHAEFPGLRGRVYRALVIGTRGHVLAVTRILRSVKRRAERPSGP